MGILLNNHGIKTGTATKSIPETLKRRKGHFNFFHVVLLDTIRPAGSWGLAPWRRQKATRNRNAVLIYANSSRMFALAPRRARFMSLVGEREVVLLVASHEIRVHVMVFGDGLGVAVW